MRLILGIINYALVSCLVVRVDSSCKGLKITSGIIYLGVIEILECYQY